MEYLIRMYRLDEIHYKSVNRTNNILDDQDCRSPSPPPIYNENGKRINIREVRDSEAIIKEKSNIIEEAMRINPTFIPPHDFKVILSNFNLSVYRAFTQFVFSLNILDLKEAKEDLLA